MSFNNNNNNDDDDNDDDHNYDDVMCKAHKHCQ